jgi:hypothetical protein
MTIPMPTLKPLRLLITIVRGGRNDRDNTTRLSRRPADQPCRSIVLCGCCIAENSCRFKVLERKRLTWTGLPKLNLGELFIDLDQEEPGVAFAFWVSDVVAQ